MDKNLFKDICLQDISESNWDDLYKHLKATKELSFYYYAFLACLSLKIDIFNLQPLYYKIDNKQIIFDLKTRLYFLARKKYEKAGNKKKSILDKLYPSEIINGKVSKERSYFDKRFDYFSSLQKIIDDKIAPINKKMEILASSNVQKKIYNNFILWQKLVACGLSELTRYKNYAENFAFNDYKDSPTIGNYKILIFSLILLTYSLFTFIFCLVDISLDFANLNNSPNWSCKMSGVLVSIMILSLLFTLIIKYSLFSDKKWLIGLSASLGLTLLVSFGLRQTFSSLTIKGVLWFQILGIILSFVSLLLLIYIIIKYKPSFKKSRYTYIGDYKNLFNDSLDIKYDFRWRDENIYEKSKRKKN